MSNQMNDVLLKISAQDRMRMEKIVMDRDGEDAIALVKQWLRSSPGRDVAECSRIWTAERRNNAARKGPCPPRAPLFFAHCGPINERLARNLRDGEKW